MTRASGKARRWPDLLIGLLVVLLLAGFAFLLVGQHSQPVAQAPTPATPPTTGTETAPEPEPITIPTAPGTEATGGDSGATATTPPTSEEGGATSATTDGAATPADQSETGSPAASAPSTGTTATTDTPSPTDVPVVPAAPIGETPPATTDPATTDPAAGEPTSTPTPPATAPATPPRTAAPVATSEARTPLRSDYRVSLGSFATRRTAERLTQGVRDLGYTVYPIDLGDQVVAQIGPFADEASARRALEDIRRAYPGAVLYPPRGRSLRGDTTENTVPPASTPAPAPTPDTGNAAAPTPAAAAPAPAPATPAPPEAVPAPSPTPAAPTSPVTTEPKASAPAAPGGPVYLQLGAFDRVESAQDLVTRLRGEGYAPTVNAPDGRKVTVLVGPFSGPALSNAETNLAANGHDFFRVR